MTVHSTHIVCAPEQQTAPPTEPTPGPPDWTANMLEERFQQNVLNTHTEALPNASNGFSTIEELGVTVHNRALYRFETSSTKAALLDDVEAGVVTDAKWYEIRYHECTHDATDPTPCPNWTVERSQGTVPGDV